ncbi:MAG: L,D-transpeptidase [Brevefilum sp.]|nr:L,D-transpeptidase [Brevefilum sp.]MDW7754347.1 L,D-transpeptidase [Brevefilum sp.]
MSTNKVSPSNFLQKQFSRRDFIRSCVMGMAGLTLPMRFFENSLAKRIMETDDQLLGRVTRNGHLLFKEPDEESKPILAFSLDDLLKITGARISENDSFPNRVWYEIEGKGFAHSRYIQPVRNIENKTNTVIPGDGCLGEITVPYVDAFRQMDINSQFIYRLYYASTYWVEARETDRLGNVWYKLLDDRYYNHFYVPAVSLRLVPSSELLPISPDVPWDEKRIEVDLAAQVMKAYEGDEVVFMSRISSGRHSREGGFLTPKGSYRTTRKRPCRHMAYPSDNVYIGYDLPGVPWVSYFTSNGVAFHGTYWHNDFGVPHSHGCINLTPEAAKWVYRWTTPAVPPKDYFYSDDNATRVIIR